MWGRRGGIQCTKERWVRTSCRRAIFDRDDSSCDIGAHSRPIEERSELGSFRRSFSVAHDEVANDQSLFSIKSCAKTQRVGLQKTFPPWESNRTFVTQHPDDFQGLERHKYHWFHDKVPVGLSRTEDEHGKLGISRELIHQRCKLSAVTHGMCVNNFHLC
jgi:hypothetical protein